MSYLRNHISHFTKIHRICCINTRMQSLKVWLKSVLPWLKYSIFKGDCFYWHTLLSYLQQVDLCAVHHVVVLAHTLQQEHTCINQIRNALQSPSYSPPGITESLSTG